MKLGIIGSGMIVQEFLPVLAKLEDMEITAVQGTARSFEKVKALCRENGVAHACSSFEELVGLDIDTVYVAVPNFLHFSYCRQALEHGLHVIVEKPMASNSKELKALIELAGKKGLFLFEAVTTLYFDSFARIKEWLPRIGTVKLVQSQYSQYSSRYDAFRKGEVLPVFDPEKAGGAMMDLNLYNLHMVMGLFGRPTDFRYYANVEQGIDTSGVLAMQYDGFQALCIAAKDCKGLSGLMIQGTDGCITTGLPVNVIGTARLEQNDGTAEVFPNAMKESRAIPEFRFFIRAIREKDYDACGRMLEKSLMVSEVQTEARLSAGIRFPADEEWGL